MGQNRLGNETLARLASLLPLPQHVRSANSTHHQSLATAVLRGDGFNNGKNVKITARDSRTAKEVGNANVFSVFRQYGLPRPELLRGDASALPFRGGGDPIGGRADRGDREARFDCIVSDPPYGIRAPARRSGSKKSVVKEIAPEHLHDHIPQTQPYGGAAVMRDLLDLAARTLFVGGRLVYLLPCMRSEYREEDLPKHPCLEPVANSEQVLSSKMSRRLITLVKVKPCRCSFEAIRSQRREDPQNSREESTCE